MIVIMPIKARYNKRNFLLAIPECLIEPMDELREKLGYRSRTEMLNDLARKACIERNIRCDEPVWKQATHVAAVETPEMLKFLSSVGRSQLSKALGLGDVPDVYAEALAEYQAGNLNLIQTLADRLKVNQKTLAGIMNSMGWSKRRIMVQNDYPRMLWIPPFTGYGVTRYEEVRLLAEASKQVVDSKQKIVLDS